MRSHRTHAATSTGSWATITIRPRRSDRTDEVSGRFEHRGAAMQEARFVIDEIAPHARSYEHRLMGYNNDPTTTFRSDGRSERSLRTQGRGDAGSALCDR